MCLVASEARMMGLTNVPGSCLKTPPTAPVTPFSSCSLVTTVYMSVAVLPIPCMENEIVKSEEREGGWEGGREGGREGGGQRRRERGREEDRGGGRERGEEDREGEGEGREGGRERERERERERGREGGRERGERREKTKKKTNGIDNIIGVGKSFSQIQRLMRLVLMHQLIRRPFAW